MKWSADGDLTSLLSCSGGLQAHNSAGNHLLTSGLSGARQGQLSEVKSQSSYRKRVSQVERKNKNWFIMRLTEDVGVMTRKGLHQGAVRAEGGRDRHTNKNTEIKEEREKGRLCEASRVVFRRP